MCGIKTYGEQIAEVLHLGGEGRYSKNIPSKSIAHRLLVYVEYVSTLGWGDALDGLGILTEGAANLAWLLPQVKDSVGASCNLRVACGGVKEVLGHMYAHMTYAMSHVHNLEPEYKDPVTWVYLDLYDRVEEIRAAFSRLPIRYPLGSPSISETKPADITEAIARLQSCLEQIRANTTAAEREVYAAHGAEDFDRFRYSVLEQLAGGDLLCSKKNG